MEYNKIPGMCGIFGFGAFFFLNKKGFLSLQLKYTHSVILNQRPECTVNPRFLAIAVNFSSPEEGAVSFGFWLSSKKVP